MTVEELEDAIKFFKEVSKTEVGTYCKLAIEALEQREKQQNEYNHDIRKAYNDGEAFILDMLRKEVEQIQINRNDDSLRETYRLRHNIYCDGCEFIIKRILETIDKYKEGFILPLSENEVSK